MTTRIVGLGAAAACLLVLSACSPTSEGGNPLYNIVRYGGTTVPPSAPDPVAIAPCPQVDVIDGGAALRTYAGGRAGQSSALRSQISLTDFARECSFRADGSIAVRIGVEGRALVGPAGGPGTFDAPLRFVVRGATRVYDSRVRRVSVAVASGQTQGSFAVVEDELIVPAAVGGNYIIEVGLGAGGPQRRG